MRKLACLFSALLLASLARGQEAAALKGLPLEIISGDTRYENGIAYARDNVAIHIGDTDIYADSAQYDSQKQEILLDGNVRIYRDISLFVSDRAIYNVETKEIKATEMRTSRDLYFVSGEEVSTISEGAFRVQNGSLTTHDSSHPDFRLRARTIRFYQGDRVIFQNVTFLIGKVPIFYWPYLYQSLDDEFSFLVSPAYLSSWGPSLLGRVNFPITDHIKATLRLDYRVRRGAAIGFATEIKYGKNNASLARIRTYFLQDQNPEINRTSLRRGELSASRYRLSLENRTIFSEDIYGITNVTKLSDPFVLQDFFQSEFRADPQPDNVVALTKVHPLYALTAIARFQANDFFETTERLPEVALDVKRQSLFGSPIFYEGETGIANLRRRFADGSPFQNYGSWRFDSFHQLLYPNTYFGWLSLVPRVGVRGTYYSETRDLGKTIFASNDNPLIPDFLKIDPTVPIGGGDGKFRGIFNTGLEASFKVSRTWENAQSRQLGLDGLRHIIQPFTNFSYVATSGTDPAEILQFDRYQPATQLRPIDFPQFTTIDSIDNFTIWRVGMRNRLQTRRDDSTVNWMELETYVDVNLDSPYDKTPYSNLFNNFHFAPLPWASLDVGTQVPAFDKGFTEVNTRVNFQPTASSQLSVGHRYLKGNPFFSDSSQYVVGGYYRLNENWGFGVQEQYEATTGILEQQRYSVYRDLTSWVASVGAVIRDNGGVKEYGVLLTFTLKALPKFSLDLNYDPNPEQNQ